LFSIPHLIFPKPKHPVDTKGVSWSRYLPPYMQK
jgi:hypothetical protein